MAVDVRYNPDSRLIEVRNTEDPAGTNAVTFWTVEQWEEQAWRPIVAGEWPALATRRPVPNGGDGTRGRMHWTGVESFDDAAWSEFEARIRSGELSAESIVAAASEGKGKG